MKVLDLTCLELVQILVKHYWFGFNGPKITQQLEIFYDLTPSWMHTHLHTFLTPDIFQNIPPLTLLGLHFPKCKLIHHDLKYLLKY